MAEETADELESAGLVAHSYDALFSGQRRIRKISDLQIPIRAGLAHSQIAVGALVFFVQVLLLGFIVAPLFALLRFDAPWWFPILWIFGPVVLVAQRVVKPMPHGKGIADTLTSWLRMVFDDPVHARGRGVPRKEQPQDIPVVHYQREWIMFDDFVSSEDDGERAISDASTESRFATSTPAPEGGFASWWDDMAFEHAAAMLDERNIKSEKNEQRIGSRRGSAVSVIVPDEEAGR